MTVVSQPAILSIMRMILKSSVLMAAMIAIALAVTSCGASGESDSADGVKVVATTTMLGDIARNIVGDDGSVEVLLPLGASPHDYQPSSSQVAAVYNADLVLANGLHLEEGLIDILQTALADGVNVIEVAERLHPVTFGDREPCEDGDGDGGTESGECDPHVWFDPDRDAETALLIARSLSSVDASIDWEARADSYAVQLVAADDLIVSLLEGIPPADRLIVTNHDSFGYFAERYRFVVVGTVIPGGSTLSEPSSADLADLVRVINETGVSAIFTETTEPAELAEAIARESDHVVLVVPLYTGSLGPSGSGADTLIGMLTTNAGRIADGLS
jgi:zinc/manganese transport system substrate-binding protein